MLKSQRSKLRTQAVSNLLPKILKRKNVKKGNGHEPDLKHRIVKLFTQIGKQQINKQQLKWMLLSLHYNSQEIQPLLTDAFKSNINMGSQKFYISDVFALCEKYPASNKWRKQCFERFTKNKKAITLIDFQGVWDSMNKIQQTGISHQSLVQIVKSYGLETDGSINFTQFDNLLKQSNPFI